MSHFKFPKV